MITLGWLLFVAGLVVSLLTGMQALSAVAFPRKTAAAARERYDLLVMRAYTSTHPTQAEEDARVCADLERASW